MSTGGVCGGGAGRGVPGGTVRGIAALFLPQVGDRLSYRMNAFDFIHDWQNPEVSDKHKWLGITKIGRLKNQSCQVPVLL